MWAFVVNLVHLAYNENSKLPADPGETSEHYIWRGRPPIIYSLCFWYWVQQYRFAGCEPRNVWVIGGRIVVIVIHKFHKCSELQPGLDVRKSMDFLHPYGHLFAGTTRCGSFRFYGVQWSHFGEESSPHLMIKRNSSPRRRRRVCHFHSHSSASSYFCWWELFVVWRCTI